MTESLRAGAALEPRSHFRLIAFDFDGTLADSLPFIVAVSNELADRYRFRRIREDQIPELRTYDVRRLLHHVGLPVWKLPFLVRDVRRRMAQDIERIRLFPGIDELLSRLADGGFRLAIVSSNSEPNVRRVLGRHNEALIAHFECGASLFGKAARLRRLARRCGIPGQQILCIGDETRDVDAARDSGMAAAAVSWGYAAPEALRARSPIALFEDPARIASWLGLPPAPVGA